LQVPELQTGVPKQPPSAQVVPGEHPWQAAPFEPQVVSDWAAGRIQAPAAQQPPQLCGPHPATQTPTWQDWVEEHGAHAEPPAPH
jgi:hypothetical protein